MKYIAHYNGKVQKWFPRSVNSGGASKNRLESILRPQRQTKPSAEWAIWRNV